MTRTVMHRILVASCCLALIACTPSTEDAKKAEPAKKTEPAKQAEPEPAKPEPEPAKPATEPGKLASGSQILGLMQTTAGLTLQVESGGCRKAADVAFTTTSGALAIASVAPDSCERFDVLGTEVLFPWADVPTFTTIAIELAGAEVVEPGKVAGPSVPEGSKDEPLFGVLIKPDGLDVRVFSGGCTAAEHFAFYVEPGAVQQVHIVRTKEDSCEAFLPEGELLHFTWEQLGVTAGKARVANPFEKLIVK